MDAATYVRVQSIFFEVSVVFTYIVTHYASGSVADLLVPSSSLPSIKCAHRQHFPSASLLRCAAHFMKEPAPQPVLHSVFSSLWRSWGRSSSSAVVRFLAGVLVFRVLRGFRVRRSRRTNPALHDLLGSWLAHPDSLGESRLLLECVFFRPF